MKVAFATTDGRHVQGELRRASLVVVYEVGGEGWQLERLSSFDGHAHRSQHRLEAIEGVSIAFAAAMGPSTAARLAARGIRPATAPEGTTIDGVLTTLSATLAAREVGSARCA